MLIFREDVVDDPLRVALGGRVVGEGDAACRPCGPSAAAPPSGAGRTPPPAPSAAAARQCARRPATGSRPRRSPVAATCRARGSDAASGRMKSLTDAPVSSRGRVAQPPQAVPVNRPDGGRRVAVAGHARAGERAEDVRRRRAPAPAAAAPASSCLPWRTAAASPAGSSPAPRPPRPRPAPPAAVRCCRSSRRPASQKMSGSALRLRRRRAPCRPPSCLGPQRQQVSVVDDHWCVSVLLGGRPPLHANAICERPLSTSDRQAAAMSCAFSGVSRSGTSASRL